MARILIVDDDPGIRDVISAVLRRAGHEIAEASNGRQAESVADATKPDLVILDILMPEREGIETLRALRRNQPNLKVLVISGGGERGHLDFLEAAEKFGADATLAKPFDPPALLEKIKPLLP